ncbi:MAG: extracellular solute-binding protein [Phycisphaerales bacterium JB043]
MRSTELSRRSFLQATAALGASSMLVSCTGARSSGEEVVLYSSADDAVARELVNAFESASGIRVRMVGDTEATKTTGLVQRLRTERGAPRADVFWSSEIFQTIRLADESLFEPHDGPEARARSEMWVDPQGRWHAFGNRARVLVWNTDVFSQDDAPNTFRQLVHRSLRGRLVMADPRFGTTRGHMGVLHALWGPRVLAALFTGLGGNDIRLLDGNASVVEAVAYGEAHIGITDTDDVWSGLRNGWPIGMSWLRHDAGDQGSGPRMGTLVIPNTVARVRGGPNPENASILAEFLLSAQTESLLAQSDSRHNPVRADVAPPDDMYRISDAMEIDYALASAHMDNAVDLVLQAIRV